MYRRFKVCQNDRKKALKKKSESRKIHSPKVWSFLALFCGHLAYRKSTVSEKNITGNVRHFEKFTMYSGFPESNKTPPTTEVREPYLPFTASTQAMMLGCRPRPYLAVTHPRPRSQDARVIACRLGTCGLAPARTGLFPARLAARSQTAPARLWSAVVGTLRRPRSSGEACAA